MADLMLPRARQYALWAIGGLIGASALVSFAESYRGLYLWASHHKLAGVWAAVWPLQVDTFIAVGELALFVGLAQQWSFRSRVGAWFVTGLGLAVSVAGNIGHIQAHALTDRGTAAIPPLAAASALAVGLGVLKRVVNTDAPAAKRPESFKPDKPDKPVRSRRHTKTVERDRAAAALLAQQPDLNGPGLGGLLHVSPRTGRRTLARLTRHSDDSQAERQAGNGQVDA
jgi:hypothetical protein